MSASAKLNRLRKLLDGLPAAKWEWEPHGQGWALYSGRDQDHHGLNILSASNSDAFDRNGAELREFIALAHEILPILCETANVALRLAQMNAVDPIGERDTKTGLCEVRCPHCALRYSLLSNWPPPHREWCVLGIAIKCAEALV